MGRAGKRCVGHKLECGAPVAGTARRWVETLLEAKPYILRTG
jgi:hypothetical protein